MAEVRSEQFYLVVFVDDAVECSIIGEDERNC